MEEKYEVVKGLIESYFKWSCNGTHDVIIKYLNELRIITNVLRDYLDILSILDDYNLNPAIKSVNTSNIENDVLLVSNFIKRNNYDIDIDNIMKNNMENYLKDEVELENDGYFICKNGRKIFAVKDNNCIEDSYVLMHELSHFMNLLKIGVDTPIRDVFTEAIAYAEEHIFIDYLEEKDYITFDMRRKELFTLLSGFNNNKPILDLFYVYKMTGDIKKEDYTKVFNCSTNYEVKLEFAYKVICDNYLDIQNNIYLAIAFIFGYYMYIEYRKDNRYIKKIQELSNKICDINTFEEVFEIIGLKSIGEESMYKIINNIDSYIKYMDRLNKRKRVRKSNE